MSKASDVERKSEPAAEKDCLIHFRHAVHGGGNSYMNINENTTIEMYKHFSEDLGHCLYDKYGNP